MEIRNVSFNDALKTFYYGYNDVGHVISNHINSEIGNPLPTLRVLRFSNFYEHYSIETVFGVPVVGYWLQGENTFI